MKNGLKCIVFHNLPQVVVIDSIKYHENFCSHLTYHSWDHGVVYLPEQVLKSFQKEGWIVFDPMSYAKYLSDRMDAYSSSMNEPDSREDLERSRFFYQGHALMLDLFCECANIKLESKVLAEESIPVSEEKQAISANPLIWDGSTISDEDLPF